MDRADAVVIGAGLTGVTAALELARAGIDVALVEQDSVAFNRASLRNEGKIHLGFVFAHDASLATANLMIAGALRFRSLLSRLAGPEIDRLTRSHPFTYTVPHDSLLGPDEVEQRFAAIEAEYRRQAEADSNNDYLGSHPTRLYARVPLASLDAHLAADGVEAAFSTAEVAIDTQELALCLRRALANERRIRILSARRVERVVRVDRAFSVVGTGPGGGWDIEAGHVVNATWENRFAIDATAAMRHAPGWLHRLKYRVIAQLPPALRDGPSLTMVVGRYGDVVIRQDGTAYFSWYPGGLRGWTSALAPPSEWNAPCRGEVPDRKGREIAAAMLGGIDRWYPGAAASTVLTVDAGVIVAYGATDVDDPSSGLHDRTRVGVTSAGRYHSVDPGKLTTAPMFGMQAARAVLDEMAAVS